MTAATNTVGGCKLFYEEAGSGEVVILIHAHSVDCTMWDNQYKELSLSYRVIRYDLRGYGKSDMPAENEQFLHVDDLKQLMDELNIQEAHLIGLSLGSMVALDMLGKYPERVQSVVCASSGLYAEERIWNDDVSKSNKTESRDNFDPVSFRQRWMELMMTHGGAEKERIKEPLRHMVENWTLWQPRFETDRPLLGPPLNQLLKQAREEQPLLVIIGGMDSEGSRGSSKKLLEFMPGAKAAYLPEAGHFVNMEQPEWFNQTVLEFLTKSKKSLT